MGSRLLTKTLLCSCRRPSNCMDYITVHIASQEPMVFRSSKSGPPWSSVVTWVEDQHGPGVLQDAEGYMISFNRFTDDDRGFTGTVYVQKESSHR